MTARLWSRVGEAMALIIAGALLLPGPLPLPTPPSLPALLPSPTAPAVATPAAGPPATGAQPTAAAQEPTSAPADAQPAGPQHGVSIPFTAIYVPSPVDAALIAALMVLPLLLAIWLLVFGRTIVGAGKAREAHLRLRLAADLGLHPRDLASMSTKKLFRLREKAAYDELTGVLRAAAGIGAADREIVRARRHRSALSVAFIDVDDLKDVNQNEGRAAGDAMLRRLVELVKRGLEAEDVLVRYAGDEFVCVLPETTLKRARDRVDGIQREAAAAGIRFAAGFAQLEGSDDVVSLFARADRDLYEFKAERGAIVELPRPEAAAQ